MLCLGVKTNLDDRDEDQVVFGPYSFTEEEEREGWCADMDEALTDLTEELLRPYVFPTSFRFEYHEFEGLYSVAPAPSVNYLIDQLRQLWKDESIVLRLQMPV